MTRPEPLPHPVAFVTRVLDAWRDVAGLALPPTPDAVADRLRGGYHGWIVQTWLVLKRRGHDVTLVDRFPAGGIAVVHCDHVSVRERPWRSFVVAVRADRPPARLCDHQVVQNELGVRSPREHFMPYWPQPGLRPRDPSRGDRVERVGFIGRDRNLAEPFKSPAFRAALEDRGLELVIREEPWNDYRDLDVVLAVRSGRPRFLAIKPPSKLVNAWLAGCPALLGPEPAYAALRTDPLDYVEVRTPDEALAELTRLRAEPRRYRALVEQGGRRAQEFTLERMAERWEALLAGPIAADYERWRAQRRHPLRALGFCAGAAWQAFAPNRWRR
jgi:hypothetical protein